MSWPVPFTQSAMARDSFLVGPGGFGKTSILRAAQASTSRSGAVVLYVNAESEPDVGTLVGKIVAGAAAQVFEGAEDGLQKALRFFFHLEMTSRRSLRLDRRCRFTSKSIERPASFSKCRC